MLAAALGAMLLATPPACAQGWQPFEPVGFAMSVEMPGEVFTREDNPDPAAFETVFDYGSPLDDGLVVVSVFILRPGHFEPLDETDVVTRIASFEEGPCTVEWTRRLPEASEGHAIRYDCGRDISMRGRVYVANGNAYRLTASGPADFRHARADRFFDSFHLLPESRND